MKTLLTIGIPTYNRPDHLNARLLDLEKLGYFNHPHVQIIIHDNNSTNKEHCLAIRNIQKRVANLELIESSPNIGMVRGCYKILLMAKGSWITLLGDDDPIIMRCSQFLSLIKENKNCDHLYFKTKIHENGKINRMSWFPRLKTGNYKTSALCAKTGFTTHFAFLGSHCFRNNKKSAEIWMKSHSKCMFYGHCVMLLEQYKKSFYTGKTVAAWNSGNERISNQLNMFRHLELRNLFKYPPSKAIRDFILLKPWEVVEQGRLPLINHIIHPEVDFINEYERLPKKSRIKLLQVSALTLNPFHKIVITSKKRNEKGGVSCVFINDSDAKKSSYKVSIVFSVGPSFRTNDIIRIIAKLHLKGPIFLNDTEVSDISLVKGPCSSRRMSWGVSDVMVLVYAIILYGTEWLDRRKIIINYFNRPRKGLYKIINALEKVIRIAAKTWLTPETYYQIKKSIFGMKHFPERKKLLIFPVHSGSKNKPSGLSH
jgi:glycosyltransferase involved in cell wall biosynthesis